MWILCFPREKEMATHSSVLAWRIPGSGEPGGLLSMGSHRVGHDWSDLAAATAAAAAVTNYYKLGGLEQQKFILSQLRRPGFWNQSVGRMLQGESSLSSFSVWWLFSSSLYLCLHIVFFLMFLALFLIFFFFKEPVIGFKTDQTQDDIVSRSLT